MFSPFRIYKLLQRLAAGLRFLQAGPQLGQGRRRQDQRYRPHRSSFQNANALLVALAAYWLPTVFGNMQIFSLPVGLVLFLAPIALYIYEKQSGLVQFHALQSGLFLFLISGLRLGLRQLFGVATNYFMRNPADYGLDTWSFILYTTLSYALTFYCLYICIKVTVFILRWEEYSLPLVGPVSHWLLRRL